MWGSVIARKVRGALPLQPPAAAALEAHPRRHRPACLPTAPPPSHAAVHAAVVVHVSQDKGEHSIHVMDGWEVEAELQLQRESPTAGPMFKSITFATPTPGSDGYERQRRQHRWERERRMSLPA